MNIELYSLSFFQFKTLSQKDITFKCSSFHEFFEEKTCFPKLIPVSSLAF